MSDGNRIQIAGAKVEQEYLSAIYIQGIVAGLIGAGVLATWFLILDSLNGRPLYTPSVLGSALFRSNHAAWEVANTSFSLEMTVMYTWVHLMVFIGIGGIAAWLLHYVEDHANFGFAVLLLAVFFELAFLSMAFLVAEPILGL